MNVPDKIRLLLVDDHTLLRESLKAMLQDTGQFEVVGTASSGEDAISLARTLTPDIILMDILLRGMTGIEATRWIKEQNNAIRIILLSSEVRKEFVSAGIQSGIDGYLLKDIEKETLIGAIRAVFSGERFFNEAITKLVFEDFFKKERTAAIINKPIKKSDLTKREQEVLVLVAAGHSNKEVAEALFISIKTVETHKSSILDKLGLKNTAELVRYAIKNKLITLD